MSEVPAITLVKKQVIADRPADLTPQDEALEQTLSMLCSFYSVSDFISFVSSPKFSSLAMKEKPWIGFEIGLYKDHTKTIDFFASDQEFILADVANTGAFEQHMWKGSAIDELEQALLLWLNFAVGSTQ